MGAGSVTRMLSGMRPNSDRLQGRQTPARRPLVQPYKSSVGGSYSPQLGLQTLPESPHQPQICQAPAYLCAMIPCIWGQVLNILLEECWML
jgi:hypothetical protein